MRKSIATLTIGAAGVLALTGCGKGIDDITADTPRAERDEIFVAWVEDTYAEDYPNMNPSEAPEVGDGVCMAHDVGMEDLFYMGVLEGVPTEDLGAVRDILTTAVRVYCPEHATPAV